MTASGLESVPRKKRLEVDFEIGEREYFLRQSSSGLVAGPKSKDAYDRHVTFALDVETEELKHVHMKSGRNGVLREDWRIIPRRLMPDISVWIRKNSEPVNFETVSNLDRSSQTFSIRRMMITVSIVEPILTRIIWIICRGLGVVQFSSKKTGGESHFRGTLDIDRLTKQLRSLRPFRNSLAALIRATLPQILRFMAKIHRVRLRDMAKGDVCLVFPEQLSEPIIIVKDAKYLRLSLELALRDAMAWFANLKLSEMMPNLGTSTERPVPIHIRTRGS